MSDPATPPRLRLRRLPGRYAVCRLAPGSEVEPRGDGFFSLTRTAAETSVVCREEVAPARARIEPGWLALEVEGPLAFSEVGVLASLAAPLAAAGVSIFVVSTFDTDYLLVRNDSWPAARDALDAAGFRLTWPELQRLP